MSAAIISPKKRISERTLALRAELWPDVSPDQVWTKEGRAGWTTIPRLLPIIMSIIDDVAEGKLVSSTYIELWCRAHDEGVIILSDQADLATHSGFIGQRAVRTWRERILTLSDMGFIKIAPGSSGSASYALILNPYLALQALKHSNHPAVTPERWNALRARMIHVGASESTEVPSASLKTEK